MTTSINCVQMKANSPNTGFASWSRIGHYLPECVVPLLRMESLSDKCTKLHTVTASNNRDHKITLAVTISKYHQLFTSFTSIIRDRSPRPLHIACSCHIYWCYSSRTSRLWWIAHSTQRQPRGCNTTLGPVMLINRKFDISCKLDISRNLSTFPSQLH